MIPLLSNGAAQTPRWKPGRLESSTVRSNRLAHLLKQRGLCQGDRLAVYLANRVELIDLYLACVKAGILFVPINVLYREREVAHVIRDAEPKAVVTAGDFPHTFQAWHCEELSRESLSCSSDPLDCALDGDSPAALVYTSGTTGTSKGAVLTHNNFASNALNLQTAWQITQADRLLLPLPLFHVHGLGNGLHCWLASGCRMRLQERFESSKAGETFLDFRPTLFFGVPTIYVRLLEIIRGGSSNHRSVHATIRERFGTASRPCARSISQAFRPHDSRTVWNDRDADEPQQPIRR